VVPRRITVVNPVYVLCAVIALPVAAGSTWAAARIWRRGLPYGGRVPPAWGWGKGSWLAYMRTVPLWATICWLAAIGFVYAFVLDPLLHTQTGLVVKFVFVWLGLLCLVVLLIASIALFNRPRALVAPSMRQHKGILIDWWDGRARRRLRAQRDKHTYESERK
jgi:hypothetical protein